MYQKGLFSLRLFYCFLIRSVSLLLLGSSMAWADLPTVEGPKSSADKTFYGQISGYLNDGIVLGGLILSAVAMLAVGNALLPLLLKCVTVKQRGQSLACSVLSV